MCDTIVAVRRDRVYFAKNSDRDPNEAQWLTWQPARAYTPGSRLRCTHLEIEQVPRTLATVLSQPFWMWGAEMGTNECGVTIGNEAVFTSQPLAQVGLTGMDLVRLGLERGGSAKAAMEAIISLLEVHGQGGGCGLERPSFNYHNSFLIADPEAAFVLETAGRHWATERVEGVRSISNGLTIPAFAKKHADRLRGFVAQCRVRQARTRALGESADSPADFMALLRDHGAGGLRYSWMNGALRGPCAHAGGWVAATQTTASWVAELRPGNSRHWATGTSTPCLSLFKPVQLNEAVNQGPAPTERFDSGSYWWRHEFRIRRAGPATPEFKAARDQLEQKWLEQLPESAEAFAAAEPWLEANLPQAIAESRPWWVRRYWRRRDQWAGLPLVRSP